MDSFPSMISARLRNVLGFVKFKCHQMMTTTRESARDVILLFVCLCNRSLILYIFTLNSYSYSLTLSLSLSLFRVFIIFRYGGNDSNDDGGDSNDDDSDDDDDPDFLFSFIVARTALSRLLSRPRPLHRRRSQPLSSPLLSFSLLLAGRRRANPIPRRVPSLIQPSVVSVRCSPTLGFDRRTSRRSSGTRW